MKTKNNEGILHSVKNILFTLCWLFAAEIQAQFPDAQAIKLCTDFQYEYAFPCDNGAYKVRLNGKYSFVDSTGNIAMGWKWYDRIETFFEDKAIVTLGKLKGICDATGRVIIPIEMDSVWRHYSGNRLWVKKQGKWGMLETSTGNVIIATDWDEFNVVYSKNSEVLWGVARQFQFCLINNMGIQLTRPIYGWIGPQYASYTNIFPFILAGRVGFMDTTGKELIAPDLDYENYDQSTVFSTNKILAKKDGHWGLLDLKGHWLIPATYSEMRGNPHNGFWVKTTDNRWGLIDSVGNTLMPPIPLDYRPYGRFVNGSIKASQNFQEGLLSSDGRWIISPMKGKILSRFKGNTIFEMDDSKDLICFDDQGKRVFEAYKLYAQTGEYLFLEKKGKWTFVTTSGWKKDINLDAIRGFTAGIGTAKQKGKWGLISEKGHWVVPPQFDEAYSAHDLFFSDSTRFQSKYVMPIVLDMDGNEVVSEKPSKKELDLFFIFKKGKTWQICNQYGVFYPKIELDSVAKVVSVSDNVIAISNPLTKIYNEPIQNYNPKRKQPIWRLYRTNGTLVSDLWFQEKYFNGSLFSVKHNDKWGLLGLDGKFIFPCLSDYEIRETDVTSGRYLLRMYGEYFYVPGKWLSRTTK